MKKILVAVALTLLTGCMTDKEFVLRQSDIQAKQAHQQTFPVLQVKGKMVLEEGSELVVQTPTQPFVNANIPDGAATVANAITDVANVGAIAGTAAMGICKAGDSTKVYNNATTATEE